MNAILKYRLSEAGRKTSILGGGTGLAVQTIEVPADAPEFTAVVEAGRITSEGGVVLDVSSYGADGQTIGYQVLEFDAPQTAASVLQHLADLEDRRKAQAAAEAEKRRQTTLDALTERRVQRTRETIYAEGSYDTVEYDAPLWPYEADPNVTGSPEALAWIAELDAAKTQAVNEARARARAKTDAIQAANEAAAQAEAEVRTRYGVADGDDYFLFERGALTEAPCYESHKRGKNWFAVIEADPTAPGGLARTFAQRGKGDSYYILPDLSPGQAVEFGADYYTGSGKKNATRYYGYVVRVVPETEDRPGALVLQKCKTGKAAIRGGTAWVAYQTTGTV